MPRRSSLSLRRVVAGLITTGVLAIGCGKTSTEPNAVADAAASVAQVAAAVTGQDAPIADEQLDGKHLGFDTHTYPGEKTMRAWKNAPGAPYRWVGYYLPAPCHRDPSWSGKRAALRQMGWGTAVIYLGQQDWVNAAPAQPVTPAPAPAQPAPAPADTTRRDSAATPAAPPEPGQCATVRLTTQQGTAEADDAITKA
jgi:hypothetical protein